MHKVKKLYIVWEDDSGHRHLILKDEYSSFEKSLGCIAESFDEHGDENTYYEELDDLLYYFSKGCLEGEPHYVVLEEDVVDKDDLEK